jgi:hypothetical protein
MHLVPRMAKRLRGARPITLTLEVIGRDAAGNRRIVWKHVGLRGQKVSVK